MSDKLKLTIEQVINPGFASALDKLGEEPISAADKYGIARTRVMIISHIGTFREQHLALIKRIGKPEVEVVSAHLARIQKEGRTAETEPQCLALEQRVAWLQDPKNKAQADASYAVDENDPEAMKAFTDGINELKAIEFEVYLNHRIPLPASVKLTARELEVLFPILAEPVEPAAKA